MSNSFSPKTHFAHLRTDVLIFVFLKKGRRGVGRLKNQGPGEYARTLE